MLEDRGELVAEVLSYHLPGLAEFLVKPRRRGVMAEVAVDERLGPGVDAVAVASVADGVIIGIGKVNGRRVALLNYDFTVFGGSQGALNHASRKPNRETTQ